ncbi:amidohydrolase family protein [Saccharopolyspora erythraea]|uniref:amidohydrolase family protein n=1 Tax=Saccharopolyspora erythraea TaxID=1836 RepID=UPI001BAB4CF3|nr:amidohydrolase family protein [Saccharopolyspora erythraea]QUH01673.1 amidohydrolase family protein [Saccharopolyspora erythraea]
MGATGKMSPLEPVVDSNVHLWDQRVNPVFWLTDRTAAKALLGDYESLPDTYLLEDYRAETEGCGVRGIVWSDPGAADPVAAAEWVRRQDDGSGQVTGLVTLGDPASPDFAGLVERVRRIPLVRSVRVRFVEALAPGGAADGSPLDDPRTMDNLALLARHNLVATIEAESGQLHLAARIARELPDLRVVIDHFGWPTDLTDAGYQRHTERLDALAAEPNVATRIDALGTVFGDWTTDGVRRWLLAAVEIFGAGRCMLGSDLPIERLRSGFRPLFDAYGEIFTHHSDAERQMLGHGTAQRWYGAP